MGKTARGFSGVGGENTLHQTFKRADKHPAILPHGSHAYRNERGQIQIQAAPCRAFSGAVRVV